MRPSLEELNFCEGQSDSFANLISNCWKATSSERPSMLEVSATLEEITTSYGNEMVAESSPFPLINLEDQNKENTDIVLVTPLSVHQNKAIEEVSELLV